MSNKLPGSAALPPVPMKVGAGDHALALHALNVLRAELAGMTFKDGTGRRLSNLNVAGQSLDMVESLIKHHAEAQYRGLTDE